ncbi:MAG: helix-turn-helix domain-containing protein [Lachnospiraceae bacterium]|nr:helix-turn-helix domain-containing protein [Lachnospiraceae bacterium]
MISYKPLWKTLNDRKMKKMDLLDVADISRGTLASMGKDIPIHLKYIDRICTELHCQITDVIEFVPAPGHTDSVEE